MAYSDPERVGADFAMEGSGFEKAVAGEVRKAEHGDLVLAAIADRLRERFSGVGVVFRLGGDEFAVFACDIDGPEEAARVVERIRAKMDGIVIPELRGEKVSVSLGTAPFPADGIHSFDAMYQRADRNMYENKRKKVQDEAEC